jgi:hypothetical protein
MSCTHGNDLCACKIDAVIESLKSGEGFGWYERPDDPYTAALKHKLSCMNPPCETCFKVEKGVRSYKKLIKYLLDSE